MNMKSPFADEPTPLPIAATRRTTVPTRMPSRRNRLFALGAGVAALAGTVAPDEQVAAPPAPPEETAPETTAPPVVETEAPPSATAPPDTTVGDTSVAPPSSDPAEICDPATSATGCDDVLAPPVATSVAPQPSAPVSTVPTEVPGSSTPPALPETEAPLEQPSIPVAPGVGWPVRAIRFPVAGPVEYWNDWGNCRGGEGCPRKHIGNDIIADRLQPLLAATDGVITHIVDNHVTAGWGLVITDAEGFEYKYYHMNNDTPGTDDGSNDAAWRFVEGLGEGTVVTAGQVIGWVGDSGNSEESVPHLHFEIHDPTGTAINPYPSLRLAEWAGRCNNLGDPFRDVIFPMDAPVETEIAIPTPTGAGQFLLSPDGTWVPLGDATQVGYAANALEDPSCDMLYSGGLPGNQIVGGYDINVVLGAIRAIESGGDYTAQSRGSSASGAYQFIDSTWQSLGGVGHAKDASPAEQDARAKVFVERILAENGNDIALIPVVWYIGSVPVGAEWDSIPRPDAANVLTPREYQAKWIAAYNRLSGK
jgi:Peptidase family M23/Transglycosylase-like domain